MKKSLAVILAVIMICSALCACSKEEATSTAIPDATAPQATQEPTATFAPDIEIEYDEKLFTIEDTTLVKYLGSEDSVTVPGGVTVIGVSAFENCTSVKTVSLPDTLTNIEHSAFAGCTALSEIAIPKTVVAVADYAFTKCTALTKIELPARAVDIGEGIFAGCTALSEASISASTNAIPEKAFYGCEKLTSITIAGATKTIGASAFEGCKKLCDVTFSKGILSIGNRAFYGCTHIGISEADLAKIEDGTLTADKADYEIELPNSITEIGVEAFDATNWMANAIAAAQATEVDSKDRFIFIGDHGFLVKYVLADVDAVKKVLTDGNTFTGENVTVTYIPEKNIVMVNTLKMHSRAKSIAGGCFDGIRENIEAIDLDGSQITIINAAAFSNMTNLKTFKFTKNLTDISNELFKGCSKLETVQINDKLTSIGDSAFEGCTNLISIGRDLDKKAEEKEEAEYKDAEVADKEADTETGATAETEPEVDTYIGKADLTRSITTIGKKAFAGCTSLKNIVLPEELTTIGEYCFENCASVENIEFGSKITFIGVKAFDGTSWFDNWEGAGEEKTLVVGDGILIKSLDGTIPEGVKTIAAYTFAPSKSEIAEEEFYNSKLPVTITIPGTVTKISDYAFYYATNLQTVVIEEGVKEIGEKAFYACSSLTSVTLPSSVKQIKDYTFYNCTSLAEIELPDSITKIGNYAFFNCLSLEEIKYNANAQIGEEAFTNTKVVIAK